MSTVMRVGKKTVAVVAGKAITNLASNAIPFGNNNRFTVAAKQLLVAVALGTFGRRFVGGENAELMMVGGFLPVVEGLAQGLPVIGPALVATPIAGYANGSRVAGYAGARRLAGLGSLKPLGTSRNAAIRSPLGM